jgi:hypothetical protein
MVLQSEQEELKHPLAPHNETASIRYGMPRALMTKRSLHSHKSKNHLQSVMRENSHKPKLYYYDWQRASKHSHSTLLTIITALN